MRPIPSFQRFRLIVRHLVSLLFFIFVTTSPINTEAKSFSGLIYPQHDITLSAGVSGLVMKRLALPGQVVRANQLLLQLDDRIQAIEGDRRRTILADLSELTAARERLRILDTLLQDTQTVFNKTGSISKDELLRLEAEQLVTTTHHGANKRRRN
jgi:multidrug efflux pump subunit AcrA (membrane-fusion protein)